MATLHRPRRTYDLHGPPRRGRIRGQAVVEFALILPVFLILTLGVVDMARLFTSYISLTNGVSSAALYAGGGSYTKWCASGGSIPCPTDAPSSGTLADRQSPDPTNIAYQLFIDSTGLTPSQVVMSKPQCTPSAGAAVDCTSATAGAYVTVNITASYPFTFLMPLVSSLTGPITITASTSAAVLN